VQCLWLISPRIRHDIKLERLVHGTDHYFCASGAQQSCALQGGRVQLFTGVQQGILADVFLSTIKFVHFIISQNSQGQSVDAHAMIKSGQMHDNVSEEAMLRLIFQNKERPCNGEGTRELLRRQTHLHLQNRNLSGYFSSSLTKLTPRLSVLYLYGNILTDVSGVGSRPYECCTSRYVLSVVLPVPFLFQRSCEALTNTCRTGQQHQRNTAIQLTCLTAKIAAGR
jgi:hypothetical protein